MWKSSLNASSSGPITAIIKCTGPPSTTTVTRRHFHDYFVTHLPSSSLHPDARGPPGLHHKLPRDKASPHEPHGKDRAPATPAHSVGASRELTVVRIPLKNAKHHFGASWSRGQRPYNEDAYQAGTIEIPAFARRRPLSLQRNAKPDVVGGESASGDPQVFYFGVFDGHGGSECSEYLREQLHLYIERGAESFELKSTLKRKEGEITRYGQSSLGKKEGEDTQKETVKSPAVEEVTEVKEPESGDTVRPPTGTKDETPPPKSSDSIAQSSNIRNAEELERKLVQGWKDLVGGYFRRFKPEFFSITAGGQGHILEKEVLASKTMSYSKSFGDDNEGIGIETVLEYSFLQADLDFVSAQVNKDETDAKKSDSAINANEILGQPSRLGQQIGGPKRFKGGSTCSIALISTPTPMPYWNPASPATLITAHVGDTRILLCDTATGQAVPTTSNHHPNHPKEAERMRRYAATFVTDSFGEERVQGLANTRSFGDMASKRIGVSAEPEVTRIDLSPAQFAFMVLVSDGVSGTLSDQEIIDIVKEAKTPEQGAKDVVAFATEVSTEGDNATAMVVRFGGWERRSEGGVGSLGTKELRDWKRNEASDPRTRRR
ncbi:protein serine/threonine phosphatase 2C [Tothia fuscella]|uniref:Protein serine/threonine phosphatase 2C n=1 Tax=Tothia fuscella TaxID=1048955 RepID=A0A9P4NT78_9PEZI|nr:protein serine/threonine phosphatase 2C [Tothia fuscella]